MAMVERTAMNTSQRPMNTDILTLTQWLSPAYPVGAFAYSHGIETAIAEGQIKDAAELQTWLQDVALHGSGRTDCILLRAAYLCDPNDIDSVDAYARANAASAERLLETVQQGAAFCSTTQAIWGSSAPDLTYPVAVGLAAQCAQIDATLTSAMYLQAFLSNLVSAAVRAIPLGQTDGQRVLAALTPLCQIIAEETTASTVDDIQSTAFLSDIAAMRHETLQPRIFRS